MAEPRQVEELLRRLVQQEDERASVLLDPVGQIVAYSLPLAGGGRARPNRPAGD